MITIPKLFDTQEYSCVPMNFKWTEDTYGYYEDEIENEKLYSALTVLNHKATLGLAAATMEWILWRIINVVDPENRNLIIQLTEMFWAGSVHKYYMESYNFYGDPDDEDDDGGPVYNAFLNGEDKDLATPEGKVQRIIWLLQGKFDGIGNVYLKGDFVVAYELMRLISLARHIVPDTKFFDEWLKNVLERGKVSFPARYDINEIRDNNWNDLYNTKYDSTVEVPVCREFFFNKDFDVEKDNLACCKTFIKQLDYANNPYLSSPEAMKEKGFNGIPYQDVE